MNPAVKFKIFYCWFLEVLKNSMKFNKDMFEIIFFARGGQGAKTASELIAHAAVLEGKYVKAFPFFGPERSVH